MNPLKVGLAIALSTVGVGSGVAFGVANLAPVNEVQMAEAVGEYAVRFTKPNDWGTVFAYAWNNDSDKNANWPGQQMTWKYKNDFNEGVYEITLSKKFSSIIFNNNNGAQTPDIVVGDNNAWYLDGNNAVGHNFLSTMYFYDVKNTFNGGAKIYAWGHDGKNADWPGSQMTIVDSPKSSGRIYYFENFDEMFNKCIFNNGSQTGDLDVNLGHCYSMNSISSGSWVSLEKAYSDDFNDNLMLMNSDTEGQCLTAYAKAKECFNLYTADIKNQIKTDHSAALTRFAAWAAANGESFNETTMVFGSNTIRPVSKKDNWIFAIAAITSTLIFASLIFGLKKRKHQ